MANVVWAMVSYGPMPFPAVYSSHLQAAVFAERWLGERGGKIRGLGATDRTYTHSAENTVVENFLDLDDATHIFMTEQDMILPVDTIPALLMLDQPIAAGLYFLRGGNGAPCLYVKTPLCPPSNPYPHTPVTLFPLDTPFKLGDKGGCPGLGCVLIRREVFEKISPPWFDLKERNIKTLEGYGSDMFFYTKTRDAGFETWIDPRVRCGHMDYVTVDFDDHLKRRQEDPEFGKKGFIINAEGVVRG